MQNRDMRYTDEFIADAIRMVKDSGRPVNGLVKDLGLNPQIIRN